MLIKKYLDRNEQPINTEGLDEELLEKVHKGLVEQL